MDAEEKVNQKVWDVIVKIKEKDILSDWRDLSLNFGYANDEEERILFWLQDEKCIELMNLSRIPKSTYLHQPEEVKLKLIKPAFDEIYEEYRGEYASGNIATIQQKTSNKKLSKEILNDITKSEKIRGMQKDLFRNLSNMKTQSKEEIERATGTADCKNLIFQLNKKLKKYDLHIVGDRPKTWGGKTLYRLKFLTE